MIDSNLNWKSHISYVSKKIRRSVGILSKLRYYVNSNILINLYYALIYPFLIYGILAWYTRDPGKRDPGKRCAVMFCNNTNADNVSLHQFPRAEP